MEIQSHETLSQDLLKRVESLDARAFAKPLPASVFESCLAGKPGLLIQIAQVQGEDVAYKIGFDWYDGRHYFSFSGGVAPEFRRQGIATRLARAQHARAAERGFRYVRTHTKNKFKEMLLMNIAMGFEVTGFEHKPGDGLPTIVLTKTIAD